MLIVALLIAAGAAVVVQNLLMVQISSGLGVDMVRSGGVGVSPVLGAVLLVAGAWLVAAR